MFVGMALLFASRMKAVEAAPTGVETDMANLVLADPAFQKIMKFALSEEGQVLKEEAYKGGKVLRIRGADKEDMYGAWLYVSKVKPGACYRVSVCSRNTKAFPAQAEPILMVFFYKDAEPKELSGPATYVRLSLSADWRMTHQKFLVPAGTDNLAVGFRISGLVPRSEAVDFAKIRLEEVAGPYSGVPTIDFEGWDPDTRPEIRLGPGAVMKSTTVGSDLAHSGEWYLEIDGINDSTQYGMIVDDIWLKPNTIYNLSLFYRMSPNFGPNTFIVMFFQFAGEPWRSDIVDKVYWYPAGYKHAPTWIGANFDIKAVGKAKTMAILFRQEMVLPGSKLYLDDITLEKSEPTVFMNWEIDPKTATLSGTAKPSGDILADVTGVTVFIVRDERIVDERQLKPGEDKFSFDLHGLTDNVRYYVAAGATLRDGRFVSQRNDDIIRGRSVLNITTRNGATLSLKVNDMNNLFYTFIKERPWEGNNIGVLGQNDPPPPPWSPMTYDPAAQTVTTWNNSIAFGEGLASLRILFRSPSVELTTEPVALTLNGKSLTDQFSFAPARTLQTSPHRIVLEATGTAENGKAQITVASEFDGFTRYTVLLQPAPGRSLDAQSLDLTFRFPKDYVQFCYVDITKGPWFESSWALKEFSPTMWLGNYETGIHWCAERLVPARRMQPAEWASFSSSPTTPGVLIIQLINEPQHIADKPLKVEFALLPTPTKPFQPRARNVRFRTGPDATLNACGTMPCNPVKYFGYPDVVSVEEFRQLVQVSDYPKADTVFYFGVSYAMETIPQMTYFKKEWINVPTLKYRHTHPAYRDYATGDWTTVRMGNSSWTDLSLFMFKKFIEQTGIKGAYFDCALPRMREENGEWYCPVFAAREFHKRVRVLLHKTWGDHGWIICHSPALPYVAFADFILSGEHLREQLRQYTYYQEFMGLPEIRATWAAPLGPAWMFLPQYWQKEKAENKALMAQVGAFTMLHDAIPWAAGQDVLPQMMRQKFNFGDLSKANWYPYWRKNPYLALATDNDAVICSSYERDGELFIILYNTTAKPQKTRLSFGGYIKQFPDRDFPDEDKLTIYDPVRDQERLCSLDAVPMELSFDPYVPLLVTVRK